MCRQKFNNFNKAFYGKELVPRMASQYEVCIKKDL